MQLGQKQDFVNISVWWSFKHTGGVVSGADMREIGLALHADFS